VKKIFKILYRGLLALPVIFVATSSQAVFEQGDKTLSIVLGSGQAFNQNYTIFGAGIGYYVVDGLKLGIDAQVWTGGDISITKVTPDVEYVFIQDSGIKPYIGAYYRKTNVEGQNDLDSTGGRAGVYLSKQAGYYLSVGVVYEKYLSCDEAIYISCSDSYPEITLAFRI